MEVDVRSTSTRVKSPVPSGRLQVETTNIRRVEEIFSKVSEILSPKFFFMDCDINVVISVVVQVGASSPGRSRPDLTAPRVRTLHSRPQC